MVTIQLDAGAVKNKLRPGDISGRFNAVMQASTVLNSAKSIYF